MNVSNMRGWAEIDNRTGVDVLVGDGDEDDGDDEGVEGGYGVTRRSMNDGEDGREVAVQWQARTLLLLGDGGPATRRTST